jgi:hypothetical protein
VRHRIVLGLTLALALALLTVSASALPAWAQADPVAEAAEELRGDPVAVDPDAERALTAEEADRLREHIRDVGTPVFVAVLPAGAGDAEEVVARLADETGLSGTYAAVVGDAFRASSTLLPDADELATAAFQSAAADGTAAVLTRFVDELAAADGGTGADRGAVDDDPGAADDDEGTPAWLLPAALVGGGAGLLWWARRRRRRDEERRAARRAEVEMIRAELAVVADDVLRLEPEVALHPEARDDYDAAVERHRVASAAIDAAGDRVDPARLERVVAEARYAMARARAGVEGRELPPPPDELRRPGRHDEPPLDVDADGAPVYAGGRSFYGDGWFGGGAGGGLFGGLLLGSMLGGWGWGGWGGPVVIDHHDGDGGDAGGDGGDGGGWGDGGDFGGGDWGGGDFGGGDFGGGDW